MPLIELKSSKKRFTVSDKDWETMKKNIIPGSEGDGGPGKPFSSRYTVIDARNAADKASLVPPELRTTRDTSNEAMQADAARKRNQGPTQKEN